MSEAVKPRWAMAIERSPPRRRCAAGLVEIDAPTDQVRGLKAHDDGFANQRSGRELLEHVIDDEALIDAAQSIGKPFGDGF